MLAFAAPWSVAKLRHGSSSIEMSKGTKQQELERQAQKSFSKEGRAKEGQQRFTDEEERRRASASKGWQETQLLSHMRRGS
jgi:hypothetical protein